MFSWGSDHHGQLGLAGSEASTHTVPRFCSYNILIEQVSCGGAHAVLLTSNYLLYSIGSNSYGQLGIGARDIEEKNTPVLIESLTIGKPV